jgi:XapX domain-containing protein
MRDVNANYILGLLLAFAVGAGCRWLGVPVPAPPTFQGVLLIFAITGGYVVADRWLS